MNRPPHLPDFTNPPLNEVAMGIQFSATPGFSQIFAREVWELFRKDFPKVQEHPALSQTFETFGPVGSERFVNFQFTVPLFAPLQTRFWFLNNSEAELIQFQSDRLLHNWRKVGDLTNPYPRFEAMIASFENEAQLLQGFFQNRFSTPLAINQCELTYVNHINNEHHAKNRSLKNWVKFLDFGDHDPEDYTGSFKFVVKGENNEPKARLSCDIASAVTNRGSRIITLTFTYRGNPNQQSIESAMSFLTEGRSHIVTRFSELTTDFAQQQWGRIG